MGCLSIFSANLVIYSLQKASVYVITMLFEITTHIIASNKHYILFIFFIRLSITSNVTALDYESIFEISIYYVKHEYIN